ncbi:hypothetical protein WMF04_07765 [Sorangium sp. So ce260]|uniref:hypothetical protein n=1 Tax=Sorangium sp. So ce260 TaxID=3133291 RepID=UPI003F61AE65
MSNATKTWSVGLGVGALAGAADISLIVAVDPAATGWVLLESFLFWTVAGWVVVASESGLGRYGHGILVTMLLNLPWYVLLGPAAGQPAHVPPLLLMSVVFGSAFGWARGRALASAASSPAGAHG